MAQLLLVYVLIINLAGIVVMYKDKKYAVRHQWRIRESTLFSIALLLGSLGILIGMRAFRHKTKHWKFVVFIPMILIIQIILAYIIFL